MFSLLSQIQLIAGASDVTILSISAHALARSVGSVSSSALLIASLTALSFSCDQLLLFAGRMFLPLNVGSRYVCGSAKSFSQPTFGQMATLAFGTLQNFVYIDSCVTCRM